METIANLTKSLDTVAKFFRLLAKQGVTTEHINVSNNNIAKRRNLTEYLKMGCPKVNTDGEVVTNQLPEGHELARLVLGDDYITPEEVAKVYGWSYSEEQLENFAETLPDLEELVWLKSNGYMLITGPPTEMNLFDVRNLNNQLYPKTESWYSESRHRFSRKDKVSVGQWLKVRKDEVPNSFSKTWDEQQDLITDIEHVPNAPTVSYAVTAYYKVRGAYLLRVKYVRTSSFSASGGCVHVGCFDKGVLDTNYYFWNVVCRDFLGVSSARK